MQPNHVNCKIFSFMHNYFKWILLHSTDSSSPIRLYKTTKNPVDTSSTGFLLMAPPTGLEPVTSWLTVMRSTDWAIEEHILAMTYSPTKRIRSTIGAGGLNFCVRDGNRCDPSAIITRISILFFRNLSSRFPQNYSMYNFSFPTLLSCFLYFLPSWSSPRLISISQLNESLHLHTWPIYQIFLLVSYFLAEWEISS